MTQINLEELSVSAYKNSNRDTEISIFTAEFNPNPYCITFSEEKQILEKVALRPGDIVKPLVVLKDNSKPAGEPVFIPSQICPICNGAGKIPQHGTSSNPFSQCQKCNGKRTIPMIKA